MQLVFVLPFLADIVSPSPVEEIARSPWPYLLGAGIAALLLVAYLRAKKRRE